MARFYVGDDPKEEVVRRADWIVGMEASLPRRSVLGRRKPIPTLFGHRVQGRSIRGVFELDKSVAAGPNDQLGNVQILPQAGDFLGSRLRWPGAQA
jgi:hypothetical protein